ncbi:hypothetical protein AeMF1_010007 [Aphanomyces euteiches]|nr:hypothetical protein AeMF1_010007 [Aphanomyces euteiches]KAH9131511.1 hypothetical protein AeNC1_019570 [Aphanomyces euteiches]
MQIQPSGPSLHQLSRARSPWTLFGILYLVFTTLCSWWYLGLIFPHLENDFWWRGYNTTGTQTFISDVFNAKLIVNCQSGPFSIIGASYEKKYSSATTFIDMRRTAARRLLLQPLPPRQAIEIMRANSFQINIATNTPYCWVDLERQWELAHTAKRQARCCIHVAQNAAVYLETILRNSLDWFAPQNVYLLQNAIFNAVNATPAGHQWLQSLTTTLSIQDELLSWQRHNLTSWTGQVQNLGQESFDDSIVLVNALGVEQRIKIASIAGFSRGLSAWTTSWAYPGLITDLLVCQNMLCSLVRGSPFHPNQLGFDWDKDLYNGNTETPGIDIIRSKLGPYVSIDLRFVQTPSSLLTFFTAFDKSFEFPFYSDSPHGATTIDAVPLAWQSKEFIYYGGNPLCPLAPPQAFVQHSFGYYDDCGSQDPHVIDLTCRNVAFAISATKLQANDISTTCEACATTSNLCSQLLLQVMNKTKKWTQIGLIDQVTQEVQALHLKMIQMATNTTNNTDVLLTQEMIADGDPWSFFGWVAIWEWVDGQREVFVFEGDEGSMTIISRPHGYHLLPANHLEFPRVACNYIRLIFFYVNVVLSGLALSLIAFGALSRFNVDAQNLFYFNRVVGCVWIGRPLLFMRGMTAILVLSTSLVELDEVHGVASLIGNRRSILEIALFAGESTWVVYVLNDLFLPFTTYLSSLSGPLSSVSAFIIVGAIEISKPFQIETTISRTCTFKTLQSGVVCTSGTVSVGSFTRVCILVAAQLSCVFISHAISRVINRYLTYPHRPPEATLHIAIPAAADAYFRTVRGTTYNLDNVACVMSGIIPAFGYVLDVKLWILLETPTSKRASGVVTRGAIKTKQAFVGIISTPSPKRIQRLWSALGFVYICLSITSSYAFLRLTEATMTNDFWWASFDLNNTQAFLCNWFNTQLSINSDSVSLYLNDLGRALLVLTQNTTDSNVRVAPAYVYLIQDEINSLPNVISALRNMNGCDVPWIFTAYCFVDFGITWELASSRARQARCHQRYASNGAVYLEPIFRNNHQLSICWGKAWEIAILAALRESNDGIAWLNKTLSAQLSIGDETMFWQDHGIISYTTQWQNFKLLGLIENLDIINALGSSYPLTLKKTNGTLQLSKQTSYKMHWGLAGDLTAISSNESTLYNLSLVRQASNFAFQNVSIEDQLVANLTLQTPLSVGMTLLRAKLGPFGSIDMYRVPMPMSLLELYQNLTKTLAVLLATSLDAQLEFWSLYKSVIVSSKPTEWDGVSFWGGDPMCPEQASPQIQGQVFFSSQGSCAVNIFESIVLEAEASFYALIATGIAFNLTGITSIEATCNRAPRLDTCCNLLKSMKSYIEHHITSQDEMKAIYATAQHRAFDVHVQLFQYISRDDLHISLSTPGLFDDMDFEFFAWVMLFEWVRGLREVVTFQGDIGSLTLLSTRYSMMMTPDEGIEVPLNLALYVHHLVQYFTIVLLYVAIIVLLYCIHSRGYIQGLNLFSFNRVAGLVWLGRPLVFVRGVTAIILLSTASLELRRPHAGLVAFLDAPPVDAIKTIFSAGEATWLAYILNDVFSLITQEYTTSYSFMSSLLLWVAAAVLSFLSPVNHSVDIGRVCTVEAVDSQCVCRSGIVRIGNSERFVGLILYAIASCLLSYAFERIRFRRIKPHDESPSLFLYAAARYQFRHDGWEYMGVYFMDRASAVLNGILSLTFKGHHYVFDIKTWRLYIYPVEAPYTGQPNHLCHALPLPG